MEIEIKKVKLQPNDVIVAGSDGLFDNLFLKDITKVLERSDKNILNAVKYLCLMARKTSIDVNRRSPFAVKNPGH